VRHTQCRSDGAGRSSPIRASSQAQIEKKTALVAALADAKAQATEIASATALTISGVPSVSASVSPTYEVTDAEATLADLRPALLAWEATYNTVRPHQALGYLTPAEYLASVAGEV
jgi:transposase InsO family protein